MVDYDFLSSGIMIWCCSNLHFALVISSSVFGGSASGASTFDNITGALRLHMIPHNKLQACVLLCFFTKARQRRLALKTKIDSCLPAQFKDWMPKLSSRTLSDSTSSELPDPSKPCRMTLALMLLCKCFNFPTAILLEPIGQVEVARLSVTSPARVLC